MTVECNVYLSAHAEDIIWIAQRPWVGLFSSEASLSVRLLERADEVATNDELILFLRHCKLSGTFRVCPGYGVHALPLESLETAGQLVELQLQAQDAIVARIQVVSLVALI